MKHRRNNSPNLRLGGNIIDFGAWERRKIMEKSDPRPHGIFDSFTGTPSEPAGSSELRSQRLSLSSMSNALPSQIVLNNTFPLSTVDEAMHPHAASSSEAILDCSSR